MDWKHEGESVTTGFGADILKVLTDMGMSQRDALLTYYVFQRLTPTVLAIFAGVMEGIMKSGPYISPIALQLLDDKLKEVSDATVAYREQMLEGKTSQELLAEYYNRSYDAPPPDEPGGTSIEQWIDDNLDLSDI